jgi:hypothetical protein
MMSPTTSTLTLNRVRKHSGASTVALSASEHSPKDQIKQKLRRPSNSIDNFTQIPEESPRKASVEKEVSLDPRSRPSRSRHGRYMHGTAHGSLHGTTHSKSGKVRLTKRALIAVYVLLALVPFVFIFSYRSTDLSYLRGDKSGGKQNELRKQQFVEFKKPEQPDAPVRRQDSGPYSPALIDPSQVKGEDDRRLLHFVKSRFMQYQPNLMALGWSRLELFKEFCMPSIVQQTQPDFFWLIYTDPDLHPDLLKAMVKELTPYPNFYLIKSLSNAMWRGGQAQNMTQATVYTGDQKKLEAAMALRDSLPVLETRLDADDAINLQYIEEIQRQAVEFFSEGTVEWMYWCVGAELEWYWLGPHGYSVDQQKYGIMENKEYVDFCPTPGLTLGYSANTTVESIYSRKHSVLVERLHTKNFDFCGVGRQGKDCYQIIRKFDYPAFRCRTPTSASMVMTDYSSSDKLKQLAKEIDPRWQALAKDFGVTRNNCRHANSYLTSNIMAIVEDALMGQCTKGHSCSVSHPMRL